MSAQTQSETMKENKGEKFNNCGDTLNGKPICYVFHDKTVLQWIF